MTQTKTSLSILVLFPILMLIAGCGRDDGGETAIRNMPQFDNDRLAAGRTIWVGTCRNCHLLGVAGAPAVTDFAEWDRRLRKGVETLYESALGGIRNADGTYRMPPHGGNSRLSEDQVKMAVDYKLAAIAALRAGTAIETP
jgi:cytochrome c5